MNRTFIIVLLFAGWFFLLTSVGFSQDNDNIWAVETEGTGLIANNDLASARNNAINDALRKAVERAVATLIPHQAPDKKTQAAINSIYTKSDQYIHDYKINNERQVQKVYAVNVRSAVFIDSIKDDLQTLGLLKVEKNGVPATEVAVTVKGLTSCADYVRVKELLKTKVKGVRNIHQREFAWGTVRLALDIQGSVKSFSDELTKTGQFSPVIALIDQNCFEVTLLKLR